MNNFTSNIFSEDGIDGGKDELESPIGWQEKAEGEESEWGSYKVQELMNKVHH